MSPKSASTIMPDTNKTSEQLLSELQELRAQVAILREAEAKSQRIAEALRESEERLRLAHQVARTGTFEWNIQTGVNTWTPELEAMYGLPPGGFPGTEEAWEQLVYSEDRPEAVRRVQEAMEKGGFEGEWRVVWPDGTVHWLYGRSFVFKDEFGKPLKLIGVNIDITERKRAEEALQESEAHRKVAETVESERRRLFEVLETLPAMICLLTPDYHVAFANRSFREKFGESHGRHCYDYCFGRAEPCEFCESYKVLETGKPHNWEVTRPDGSTIDIYDVPFTDADGSPMILEMDVDITVRKRAEEALKLTQFTLDKFNDSAIWLSPEGRVVYVNETACNWLGYSREELLSMHIWDIDPNYPLDKYHETWQELKQKGTLMFESNHRTREGKVFPVDVRSSYIEYGNNEYLISFDRDITERKRAEEELVEAKKQAELYLDLMGHDIRNMNQVGMGFLELVLDSPSICKKDKEYLLKSMGALESSTRLIENVGKVQKAQSGELKYSEIDACQAILRVLAHYSNMPGIKATFNYDLPPGCPVIANELLYEVFENIVGNAIKHTGPEPIIGIKFETASLDGKNYNKFIIEDTGPGIPDDMKDGLFNRLHRGDTKAKGSGLGLYLIKSLVDGYGGRVWIEDRIIGDHTKGARFVVLLPAVEK